MGCHKKANALSNSERPMRYPTRKKTRKITISFYESDCKTIGSIRVGHEMENLRFLSLVALAHEALGKRRSPLLVFYTPPLVAPASGSSQGLWFRV